MKTLPKSLHTVTAWTAATAAQLAPHKDREIIVLAGANYAAVVEGFGNVTKPLAGLGIGQQLAKLKSLTAPVQLPPF